MPKTVTAGGFFSVGGEVAVDVHGATHNECIIAETAVEYTILKANGEISFLLSEASFTTAERIAQAINGFLRVDASRSVDPGTVNLTVPNAYPGGPVALLTDIEQLRIRPDQVARVVIDEQSGVIVMGEHVRISTVAIAQGNLTIRITESKQVSQPNAFANSV